VWQIHNLEKRAGMQGLSQILFPDGFTSSKTETFASIQGTSVLIDEKIAYPINHVKVNCYKDGAYCELDRLYINVPNENSWSQTFHIMEAYTEFYTITRWDKDNIDGFLSESDNACRRTSFNFNFKTKEFFQITSNAGGDCKFLGAKMPKLKKPRIGQILDGKEIIQAEFEKINKAAFGVLASNFRAKVKKIVNQGTATKE